MSSRRKPDRSRQRKDKRRRDKRRQARDRSTARAGAALRGRLQLHLSFGRHETREDAEVLRGHIEAVRPQLYLQETADMPEAARGEAIRHMNETLVRLRRRPAMARAALEELRARSQATIDPVFTVEERRLLIATPGLRWFTVEGYRPDELARLEKSCRLAQDPRSFERVTAMVVAGDLEQAARFHGAALEGFARNFVAPRNDRIVAGFGRLAAELPALVPALLPLPEVRVLGRLGSAHLDIVERIAALGLRVSLCDAAPRSVPDEIIAQLTREPTARITLDESLRCLFWDTHQAVVPRRAPHALQIAEVRGALAAIGGAAGFVELVRNSRRLHRNGPAFWAAMRAALEAAAPRCAGGRRQQ